MAWRCRCLTPRRSQDGRAIAEKWLSEELPGAPDALVDFHTGDRMIQKEEFDDFVKELIGV